MDPVIRPTFFVLGSFVGLIGLVACSSPDPTSLAEPSGAPASGGVGSPAGTKASIPSDPALVARARALFEKALSEGRAFAMLQELCALAPHRLSGTKGAERAVEWGVATMNSIGLANVRKEPVMVPQWVRGTTCDVRVILPGVEEQLDCGPEYVGNAYMDTKLPALPTTLREAADRLDRSKLARKALSDRVVDFYVHTARLEVQAFESAVTDWERRRYFEQI